MIGLLLAAAVAQAEPVAGTEEASLDCEHAENQSDLNQCAYLEFEAADRALNAQWTRAVAALKARDTEVDRHYDHDPGWYDTLLAAQRAWLTFRDRNCLLASFEARGGTMAAMLDAQCKANLTVLRTKELFELAAGADYDSSTR